MSRAAAPPELWLLYLAASAVGRSRNERPGDDGHVAPVEDVARLDPVSLAGLSRWPFGPDQGAQVHQAAARDLVDLLDGDRAAQRVAFVHRAEVVAAMPGRHGDDGGQRTGRLGQRQPDGVPAVDQAL